MGKADDLDALLDDAYEALYADDMERARALCDDALRVDPNNRDVMLLDIDLLDAEGRGEEAVEAAERALAKHKDDLVLGVRLATLLLDIYDDVPGARPLLEDAYRRLSKGERPPVADEKDAEAATRDFFVDVLLTLSDCRAADHDPYGALEAAEEAIKLDKDDAMARLANAAALFDLARFDEAEKAIAQAIDRDPHLADAYWLRGRLLTVQGDDDGARRAFERAVALDPERFQMPPEISEDDFARAMEESLEELPEAVREYLQNVAIAVEDLPPLDRLKLSDPPLSPGLLGLYEGTPPSLAPGDDPWAHFPKHITLFRKNIQIAAATEDLHDLISSTLLHEVGHYLGLDEDDLEERGLG